MAAKSRPLHKKVSVRTGWAHECCHCGKRFTSKRSDAKFCSQSCRQKAHREKQK